MAEITKKATYSQKASHFQCRQHLPPHEGHGALPSRVAEQILRETLVREKERRRNEESAPRRGPAKDKGSGQETGRRMMWHASGAVGRAQIRSRRRLRSAPHGRWAAAKHGKTNNKQNKRETGMSQKTKEDAGGVRRDALADAAKPAAAAV